MNNEKYYNCVLKIDNHKKVFCKQENCCFIDKRDELTEEKEGLKIQRCNDNKSRDLDNVDWQYLIIGEV
jgi:hypothetical protein